MRRTSFLRIRNFFERRGSLIEEDDSEIQLQQPSAVEIMSDGESSMLHADDNKMENLEQNEDDAVDQAADNPTNNSAQLEETEAIEEHLHEFCFYGHPLLTFTDAEKSHVCSRCGDSIDSEIACFVCSEDEYYVCNKCYSQGTLDDEMLWEELKTNEAPVIKELIDLMTKTRNVSEDVTRQIPRMRRALLHHLNGTENDERQIIKNAIQEIRRQCKSEDPGVQIISERLLSESASAVWGDSDMPTEACEWVMPAILGGVLFELQSTRLGLDPFQTIINAYLASTSGGVDIFAMGFADMIAKGCFHYGIGSLRSVQQGEQEQIRTNQFVIVGADITNSNATEITSF